MHTSYVQNHTHIHYVYIFASIKSDPYRSEVAFRGVYQKKIGPAETSPTSPPQPAIDI